MKHALLVLTVLCSVGNAFADVTYQDDAASCAEVFMNLGIRGFEASPLCAEEHSPEFQACVSKYFGKVSHHIIFDSCKKAVTEKDAQDYLSCIAGLATKDFSHGEAEQVCEKNHSVAFAACVQVTRAKLGSYNAAHFCANNANQQYVACFDTLSMSMFGYDAAVRCLKDSSPLTTACSYTLASNVNKKCGYYDKKTADCDGHPIMDGYFNMESQIKRARESKNYKELMKLGPNWHYVGNVTHDVCMNQSDDFKYCVLENAKAIPTWNKRYSVQTYCGLSSKVRKCIDEHPVLAEKMMLPDVVKVCSAK